MRFKTNTLFGLLTAAAATVLAVPAWAETLTWDSDDGGSWTDNNWITDSEEEVGWTDGSNAVFGDGGDVPTVTVNEDVTANSVTVNDTYVFDISENVTLDMGTFVANADFFIVGSGTVKMKCGSDNKSALSIYTDLSGKTFSGNLEVDGWIDAANCEFNSSMTVTIVASDTGNDDPINSNEINVNSISYANAGSGSYSETFDANLVISGAEGQAVLLRTSGCSIEFTGSVTSEKAELQINGGGSVTFSGDVDLAKLINYQGQLEFVANEEGTNTIHIGTLELAYDSSESATYSTTFSTDATVDTLETAVRSDFTAGADVIRLTVDNGATLTIGDIILTRELDLTISDEASVVVTGNITATADAGKIVIGDGLLVTATGESITAEAPTSTLQGIAGTGTLSLEGATGENRFIVVTTDDFTGTVDVKKGHLRLDESSIAEKATLIVHASEGTTGSTGEYYTSGDVSLQFSEAGHEFTSDINIEGSGVVFVLTNGCTGSVISGDVSVLGEGSSEGEGSSVFVQKDSEGDVTFAGAVGLEAGGYINHQGTTKFTGDVSLGKLVLAQYEAGTSSVIFSGNKATVGTLSVDTSGAAGYVKTLTVTDGAVLTVTEALALNHEVEITLENGKLVLGNGVKVSSTGTDVKTTISISDGGQLEVGAGVELNSATINIVLGTENLGNTVSPDSVVTTYAESGVYAITGSGEIGDDVTIIITIDDAVAELLASGEEYTFYIYDDSLGLTLNEDSINTSALEKYGVTLNGGTITLTPEPELFSIFFGLGALGLVATRRRRRKVA